MSLPLCAHCGHPHPETHGLQSAGASQRHCQLCPDCRAHRLEHTQAITEMLQRGEREAAIERHNAHVEAELERARKGEVINLSDLMAGNEAFALDDIERDERKRGLIRRRKK